MLKLKKNKMNINWIDLIISCFLIYGSIVGFRKGLIGEIASLFGFFISIISVYYFSNQLSKLIEVFLGLSSIIAYVLSCLIIFITVIYLISFIAKLITKALKIVALGLLNRLTGLVFGLFKWVIILSSIIYLIKQTLFFGGIEEQFKSDQIENSIIYNPLSEIGTFIFRIINSRESEKGWKYL